MNPRLKFDQQFLNSEWILGIDEVGWGCVAGPVVLGGCLIHRSFYENLEENIKKFPFIEKIKDSKKVKENDRITIFEEIKNCDLIKNFIGFAEVSYINEHKLAKSYIKAIESIIDQSNINNLDVKIIIDGNRDPKSDKLKNFELIIKGDDKSFVIGVASLFAKESRDIYMRNLSGDFTKYQFEKNKGYGTASHTELIKKHGFSTEHRIEASSKLIEKK